jgi:hypothetical protein
MKVHIIIIYIVHKRVEAPWAGWLGVRTPVWGKTIFQVQTNLEFTQSPIRCVPGYFPRDKVAGAWPSPPTPSYGGG